MSTRKNQYILEETVSSAGREKFEKYGTLFSALAGQILIPSEDRTSYCYFIISGRVMACDYFPDGEKRIYYCSGQRTLIGEEYIVSEQECFTEYRTITSAELIRLSKVELLELMSHDSIVLKEILNSMANKMRIYEQRIRNEYTQTARWKLSSLLLDFAKCYGVMENGHVLIKEKISQQQMAEILGINRITAVREMKKLKEKGLVGRRAAYYVVLDMDGLTECVGEY